MRNNFVTLWWTRIQFLSDKGLTLKMSVLELNQIITHKVGVATPHGQESDSFR